MPRRGLHTSISTLVFMPEPCAGSLGEAKERPGVRTFLPTALCPVCGRYGEIHPAGAGEPDVWRLEMHDTSGRTIRMEEAASPAADCVVPDACPRCGSEFLSLAPAGGDLQATCSGCGHRWLADHLNRD